MPRPIVKFALDTSCLIPLLLEWHDFHLATRADFDRRCSEGEIPVIPAPALIECYSVITRLPPPLRASPEAALEVMNEWFRDVEIFALAGHDTWNLLSAATPASLSGGIIYDYSILQCALAAGATALVTWNEKDFRRMQVAGIAIEVPNAHRQVKKV